MREREKIAEVLFILLVFLCLVIQMSIYGPFHPSMLAGVFIIMTFESGPLLFLYVISHQSQELP